MSLNVPLPKATQIRLPTIKQGLIQKRTVTQIAETCKVTHKTIDRDLNKWYGTPDFYIWLHSLWVHLYRKIGNDELAFKEVTRLLGKGMTQKIEEYTYEKIEESVTIIDVTEDEDQILSKAASILARKERTQNIH